MKRHLKFLLPLILVILPFTIYFFTSSHSIGWVDSGAIATAAATLGIPNPPGFPAYLLIAHLFRSNLEFLSFFGAIGIILIVFSLLKKLVDPLPAFLASIALAFSYNLWSQAINIETYTVTNFFLILLLWLGNKFNESPNQKLLMLVAIIFGFSTGLNPTIAVVTPVLLFILWQQRQFFFKNPSIIFINFIIFITVIGIVYSYLPLRASAHPFLNWGDPETLDRIGKHLVGAGLNIYEPQTNSINGFTWQPKVIFESFLHFWQLAIMQFTPLLFPLIIVGVWQGFKKKLAIFWPLILILGGNFLFVVLYYGGNQESWTITSWITAAIFMGLGFDFLLKKYPRFWLLFLVSCFLPLLFWFPLISRHNQTFASDYSQNLYRDVPKNAVIIGGGDWFNSLTNYTHEVSKERSDIVPITGNMFYIFSWYRENLRRNTDLIISEKLGKMIVFKSVDEFTEAIDQLVLDNPTRQFFVTPLLFRDSVVAGHADGNYHTTKFKLIPHGLLLKVVPKDSKEEPQEKLTEFTFQNPTAFTKPPFYLERNYKNAYRLWRTDFAVSYQTMGDFFLEKKDSKKALAYFQKATELGPQDSPEFFHRLAIFFAQIGDVASADRTFKQSLSISPDDAIINQNYRLFLSQNASASAMIATPSAQITKDKTFKSDSGLAFNYPSDWQASEKNGLVTILGPKDNFQITLKRLTRPSNLSIESFLGQQASISGQLLEQGQAKIPSVDQAFVRVWATSGKTQLQFFLFQSNIVIEATVGPADSSLMTNFDQIILSLKLL